MLIREQPATDLTVATRILARAGAIAPDGRVTLRLNDVIYVSGRGVSNHTMTPYDVVSILLADGTPLIGEPPADLVEQIALHRRSPDAVAVGRAADGALVAAPSLRACAIALLARQRGEAGRTDDATIERSWHELVAEARVAGALIGAFPTEEHA
ncbi:MAG TPA: hypothetical protein VGQ86_04440 [Candidatus Limnocylindria bacterium]|nr:hypothetical protein [Candidatus Limnocylindria bacterium]